MSTTGSHHDLEIKAPEPLTTHEELKPSDSKSSVGGSSHDDDSSTTSTAQNGDAKKTAKGDAETQEMARTAKKLSAIVDPAIDRMKPLLEMINERVEKAKRTDKEELDEEALVDSLKPLIEQGTRIMQECAGAIKALDPDNKISNAASHRAKNSEATPEEQHLAQGLATLAGDVTKTIEAAKDLIKDMPHAKNKLGPLLDMFGEPLFQILSAVGLLLNGVLTLVANLLDGLGLGGIVRGLLNGLGISKLLNGIGLGKWLEK